LLKTAELKVSPKILEAPSQFEELATDLSAKFVMVLREQVDQEIARALELIRHFFGADCCRLMEVLSDRRQIHTVSMTCEEEAKPLALETDIVSTSRWFYQRLVEQGEPIVFSSGEQLPPEAHGERDFWEKSGIRAMLLLPLVIGGQLTHVIGLWNNARGGKWPAAYLRRLRLIGEIVANALIRRRDQEALLRSKKELAEAFGEINKLKEQLEPKNKYLREEVVSLNQYRKIVGVSDPLKYVLYRVQQVADTKTTVLLLGETGTGKGLFAHALHELSGRRNKPLVKVNCAGLPPNLIESELFGREKGAFTGSTARQIGRFELANGGVIFLDEIGDLPLELQAKLLKFIEDEEFERLGSPLTIKVDVRIIASTNKNLEEEIEKGRFRKDLFYRINVFSITIPPLRERKQDIPLLVKHYAEKIGKAHGRGIKEVPKSAMKALQNYSWPGNVRELINVVERAVILSDGPELRLGEGIDAMPFDHAQEPEEVPKSFAETEREHILATVKEMGWRIEGRNGAARLLGINPSTLRSRMKKLGIRRPHIQS
jgi:transcriptional regulator with GAF, ATPase, and Fis domain